MTATNHVFTYREWNEQMRKNPSQVDLFIHAMNSGRTFECDDEMFYYWLEVLPPIHMGKQVELPGGETITASFGFAEGSEKVTVFWQKRYGKDLRYFGCQTSQINPYA